MKTEASQRICAKEMYWQCFFTLWKMKFFMWAAVHFFQKPWTIYSKIKIKRARRNTLTGQSSFTGTVRAENNKSQMYLVIILKNVDNLYAKPFRGANE